MWKCNYCHCDGHFIAVSSSSLVCLLNTNARHFKPHPYTVITLLSFLHCSSQPFQYTYLFLLNKSEVKQRFSPHYASANRKPGFLAQALAHANLE